MVSRIITSTPRPPRLGNAARCPQDAGRQPEEPVGAEGVEGAYVEGVHGDGTNASQQRVTYVNSNNALDNDGSRLARIGNLEPTPEGDSHDSSDKFEESGTRSEARRILLVPPLVSCVHAVCV